MHFHLGVIDPPFSEITNQIITGLINSSPEKYSRINRFIPPVVIEISV
jgi:hypothetical protein